MRFGFIGLGNLGGAIIGCLSKAPAFAEDEILGFDVLEANKKKLAETCGMKPMGSMQELVAAADVVILTVKPHILTKILPDLNAACTDPEQMFLSVAAGRSLAYLEEGLGAEHPLVRVMPNINAMVGAATSAYVMNAAATEEHRNITEKIFGAAGTVCELPENLFPLFTAVSGSGPAFVYMFIDAMAKSAVRAGMSRSQAVEMAASTVLGSAKMVLESGVHPLELADRVCSPGGVTIEGVFTLQKLGFEHVVHEAIAATMEKNQKL